MHIYTKGVGEITWADVEEFCSAKVTENTYLDYKRDFPTDLAKTVSAMANTFGGVVIIGVGEDNDGAPVLPISGIPVERGLEERVVNTMVNAVSPPIVPEVAVCKSADASRTALVIRVAQSTEAPHAMQSNTRVYVRTGKRNAPEELADLDRIQWLTNQRQKSELLREQLLERASQRFIHMRDGNVPGTPKTDEADWSPGNEQPGLLSIALVPVYPTNPLVEADRLDSLVRDIRVRDPLGTDQWIFPLPSAPTRLVQDGLVMHLSGAKGFRTYHTHLNLYGLYFLKQSLLYTIPTEHRKNQSQPYTFLRASELIARLYEMAESGYKLYGLLGYRGPLKFLCSVHGVLGLPLRVGDTCRYSADTDVDSSIIVSGEGLAAEMQTIIYRLSRPILLAFDWNLGEPETRALYQQST
jgi:hypothetical protein